MNVSLARVFNLLKGLIRRWKITRKVVWNIFQVSRGYSIISNSIESIKIIKFSDVLIKSCFKTATTGTTDAKTIAPMEMNKPHLTGDAFSSVSFVWMHWLHFNAHWNCRLTRCKAHSKWKLLLIFIVAFYSRVIHAYIQRCDKVSS